MQEIKLESGEKAALFIEPVHLQNINYSAMAFLSKLFCRPKLINVMAPLDASTGKLVVTADLQMRWRRSQTVPPALRDQVVEACRHERAVRSAAILDVLEEATGNIKIFVSVSFDHPEIDLHRFAPKVQQIFAKYPEFNGRFFVGADIVPDLPSEVTAYRRAV